jgi:hypothetical protein
MTAVISSLKAGIACEWKSLVAAFMNFLQETLRYVLLPFPCFASLENDVGGSEDRWLR